MTIAIDTNVLVRLLVRDDEAQYAAAHRLVDQAAAAEEPVLIVLGVADEQAHQHVGVDGDGHKTGSALRAAVRAGLGAERPLIAPVASSPLSLLSLPSP